MISSHSNIGSLGRSRLTLNNKFLFHFLFNIHTDHLNQVFSHWNYCWFFFFPLPLVYVTHFQVNLLKALLWADHLHSLNGLHCSLTLGSLSSSSRRGGYLSYSDWLLVSSPITCVFCPKYAGFLLFPNMIFRFIYSLIWIDYSLTWFRPCASKIKGKVSALKQANNHVKH